MKREAESGDDERYQTVYAQKSGAIAAPTAGLHFTPELLENITDKGVEKIYVTLHVGAGTFKPVIADDIREHKMHTEKFHISQEAACQLRRKCRRVAVGTTSCRTLESIQGEIKEGAFETDIFMYPGYQFKQINSLLTNFHLPGSTLLMLVSAFAGYDLVMKAYNKAVKDGFRFYSYGDAMLIL